MFYLMCLIKEKFVFQNSVAFEKMWRSGINIYHFKYDTPCFKG